MQISKPELRLGNMVFTRRFPSDFLPVLKEVKSGNFEMLVSPIPYPIGVEMKLG